jgi:hypothetical protein
MICQWDSYCSMLNLLLSALLTLFLFSTFFSIGYYIFFSSIYGSLSWLGNMYGNKKWWAWTRHVKTSIPSVICHLKLQNILFNYLYMCCDILYTILNSWPCLERPLRPSSYGSWIQNYLYMKCLSLLMLWVRISSMEWCTIVCDKGRCFSPTPPVSSTNETDSHDKTKPLLKVVLRTIEKTMLRFTSKPPLNIAKYNIPQNI